MAAAIQNGRINISSAVPFAVLLIGLVGNLIWFSSQYGSQEAKITSMERRLERIEESGSPTLARQVQVNTDRLLVLERDVPDFLIRDARMDERLKSAETELVICRKWRDDHDTETARAIVHLDEMDRRISRVSDRVDKLTGEGNDARRQ